jgi:hypothetical protein
MLPLTGKCPENDRQRRTFRLSLRMINQWEVKMNKLLPQVPNEQCGYLYPAYERAAASPVRDGLSGGLTKINQ